ncbi:MAG: transposase [Bdellovibrionaceae bacterium]|nr:transposase [Pseudobdellovibrionaceae bacterium]
MKKAAQTIRNHEPLIMNWFEAKGELHLGAVEGLNKRLKSWKLISLSVPEGTTQSGESKLRRLCRCKNGLPYELSTTPLFQCRLPFPSVYWRHFH